MGARRFSAVLDPGGKAQSRAWPAPTDDEVANASFVGAPRGREAFSRGVGFGWQGHRGHGPLLQTTWPA